MKRFGNIYSKIYDKNNLLLAHNKAKKGKGHYREVKIINKNPDKYMEELQDSLINKTYKTSNYEVFIKTDKGKEREIYKLPYYPDRICQWAIMLQIEEILTKTFVDFSCASIPNKGIHYAFKLLDRYMQDKENSKYCLKLDIKKFFSNIDHVILKGLLRKKIKDENLLWLLDEIIDSIDGNKGIPIGNYTSQYFANFYLTYFDHWLKEEKKVKYVVRYMDDIVILHKDKKYLHQLRKYMEVYLMENLKLDLKNNFQVFPSRVRGIDFVGYKHFGSYVLLRKSTAKNLKKKAMKIIKKCKKGKRLTYGEWCSINSYDGWLKWCNSYKLTQKYLTPLIGFSEKFYKEEILNEGSKYCNTG